MNLLVRYYFSIDDLPKESLHPLRALTTLELAKPLTIQNRSVTTQMPRVRNQFLWSLAHCPYEAMVSSMV